MKNIKSFIILGAVVLVLILLLVLQPGQRVNYSVPQLKKIDTEDMTKFVIKKADTTLEIEKDSSGKWLLLPQGYPVTSDSVSTFTNTASEIEIAEFISDRKAYTPYQLDDENKIHVTVYKNKDVLREFAVGKISSTNFHTFIQLKDDHKVWTVKGDLRDAYDKTAEDIRDMIIFEFEKDEIQEVVLKSKTKTVTVKKTTRKEKSEDSKDEKEITEWIPDNTNKALEEGIIDSKILSTMSTLQCDNYLDDKNMIEYSPANATYSVTAKGKKDYVIHIFDKNDDSAYTCIASENDYVFEITGWKADDLMQDFNEWENKQILK